METDKLRDLFYHGYLHFDSEHRIRQDLLRFWSKNKNATEYKKELAICQSLAVKKNQYLILSQTAYPLVDKDVFELTVDDISAPPISDVLSNQELFFLHKIVHYCPTHKTCYCDCEKYLFIR